MPEDLKLSQIGSSPLPPPFRGLHSPRVRKHCQIIFACYFRKSSIWKKSLISYRADGEGSQTDRKRFVMDVISRHKEEVDDVELHVLGCRVDMSGTNCDQCRSMVQCCFTPTETVRLIRRGAHDGHLDFHTAPEL